MVPILFKKMTTVCVTGANGFIASWVVKLLLEKGYHVNGTVRSLQDESKHKHLFAFTNAASHLHLFEADLLVEGSFDASMKGCTALMHCASPFFTKSSNPAEDLIRPAVQGTLNVLRSAARTGTLGRVVSTSSVAAVYVTRLPHDHVYTERDWSDLEYIRESKQHYAESKVLAELAAWEWMNSVDGQSCGFTLATICPTQTLGPILQPGLNTSSAGLLDLLDGSKASIPAKAKCFVDVRDVALAHILAMEQGPTVDPVTKQERYILIAGSWPWRAVADFLRPVLAGTCAIILSVVDPGPPAPPQALSSNKRTYDLGLRYRPIEDTLMDAAMSLVETGLLSAAVERLKRGSS
jgi:nucleoside-diphosphate-sugar epimerase